MSQAMGWIIHGMTRKKFPLPRRERLGVREIQKRNLHVHLHFLVTEGGEDPERRFHAAFVLTESLAFARDSRQKSEVRLLYMEQC